MPIGVLKVPFRGPKEENPLWVDIYNKIYKERLLFLGQGITREISNQIIGLMVYLSIEDETKELYLFINSSEGWVIPGVAIYDTMQFVRPDVNTVCMVLAASMGSFILVGGEITKRLAFPHTWIRIMMRQPASGFYMAQVTEYVVEAKELLKLRETVTGVYVQRTGKPFWVLSGDMERYVFMSAT
ncbi:ATP-dependent Clp protease proteolytic subunit-like [Capsicum annuum]|uniref:ATP-dependent Clp protease proteolytic subunit-like n=1 Tax=Capsicum annuum TaxID=4072 RepID=UPI001FB126F0|nr:ATP-dependent Clp protease proteolytic subunit-like [Capsicum annuum]